MKLPLITVFILVFVHVQCGACSPNWFPQVLVDTFTNKTSLLTNFVKEKGRSLRRFYIDNVRNKITSFFGYNSTKIESEEPIIENTVRIKRKQQHDSNLNNSHSQPPIEVVEIINKIEAEETSTLENVVVVETESKCDHEDPIIHMTTPQLIALHGYASESHTIVTEDGYILTVHRIPYPRDSTKPIVPRKTVLLHHGLFGSSADWVIPGPGKGLAYYLSDVGYDVWMANVRGNTYSRAHVYRPIDSFEFWNFTFHEVSQHDLPAVIDYIMELKGWDVKINYVGHSMGTTVLFALLSTKTQYNKVLRAGFALAPVAYMTDIRSPIRLLARFAGNIEYLMKLLGVNEFLPQSTVLKWLSKYVCEINHYEEEICENSLFVFCGHDEKEFNRTLLPIILGHVPAGASSKTLIHYAQEIRAKGRFQQFDYGPEENFKHYGTFTPPEYPVYKITLPIALFSADNDWLAGDVDVTSLYVQLANPIEHYTVPMKEFNHIDFLWAIDAPRLVYGKLLQLLEDGVSKPYYNSELSSNDIV